MDEECHRGVELAEKRTMEKEGVTEAMKVGNPMEWVRWINGIRERAEEAVKEKIVYV